MIAAPARPGARRSSPPPAQGHAAAIIITLGLGHGAGLARRSLREGRARTACGSSARIASASWRRPPSSMPASPRACRTAGDLALISQSGAIAAGLVEWAAKRSVGFSAMVSLGDQHRRRFRRSARLFRARPRHARDPALRRVDQGRAQVHVGGARRRARSSRSSSSSPAGTRRAPTRREPTPARSPARTRSTTPRSAAPACCACSISTSCSPPPRRSAG